VQRPAVHIDGGPTAPGPQTRAFDVLLLMVDYWLLMVDYWLLMVDYWLLTVINGD